MSSWENSGALAEHQEEKPLLQTDRGIQTWRDRNVNYHSPIPQLSSLARINTHSIVLGFLFYFKIQNFSSSI